ncbi:phage major capsid protein [Nocardioides sp. MH1]|uniref:phage major capsid protein n=1 Tax=Nocardioides sp. MH1 TaxID=3242490 RepID=UPI00351FDBD5
MTRSTINLHTFTRAFKELGETGQYGYPAFTVGGQQRMLKTAAEADDFLGNDRAPSDWEIYARIARAASEDIRHKNLERDGLMASEQRQADHLKTVLSDAVERAERLYHDFLEERARDVNAQGLDARNDDGRTWTATARDGVRPTHSEQRSNWVRRNDDRPATVVRGQRFVDQEIVADHANRTAQRDAAVVGMHGSFGQLVRSMSTTSGSAVVPTVWAGDVIDRARNMAAVLQAGAEIVPMDAKTVQIGRLTGDPTAAFRAEGSTITASDPTFDNVTLDAKTMSALVVGSLEWFQDAENVDEIVTNAVASAIALQLDLAALYGGITAGAGAINLATPPNPRGVLGTLNAVAPSSVLGGATNGTTQTAASFYNELIDLIYTPRNFNEEPNALIWSPKAEQQYAKAYDTTGQPLQAPAAFTELARHRTNQVPSYTQGTMTSRATDVFVGDWSQLLIGQRLDLTIQTLTERFAENGQVGIVAHWRGDVGLARPRAFAVFKALQGAV